MAEKEDRVMGLPNPTPGPKPEDTADPKKQAEEMLKEAQKILAQFGGQASNIPLSSGYWEMMNQYRALIGSLPRPTNVVTEPYRELSPEALDKPYRPESIKTDMREAMAHYDRQHPAAAAVIQMEIQKENEARAKETDKNPVETKNPDGTKK